MSTIVKDFFVKGRTIQFIDKRLLSVKLPSEIKRKTRSVNERYHYKANEFRTLAFYLSFALFKGLLDNTYLNNLLKYIIFIRILSQESISKQDIHDAQKIIVDFINEYEKLYGINAMTSNVHGHLHLAKQVMLFGPLNKSSAFPFENTFKNTINLFKGTRNFEGQIAINLERRKQIKINLKKMNNNSLNPEIKLYIRKYLTSFRQSLFHSIIRKKTQRFETFRGELTIQFLC